MERLMKK